MKLTIESNTLKGLMIHVAIAVALMLTIFVVFFYYVLPFMTNKDDVITVPDVRGMTVDEASKFLIKHELNYEIGDSSYNSEVAPMTILEQFPIPSSKVKVQRKIYLKLNARIAPTIMYPDLTGSTFDFVQRQLKTIDLRVGTVQYRPDIAHNALLESRINGKKINGGDRVSKGSKIDLVIGIDQISFPLPDFTNMPYDEAVAYILGMNLKLKEMHLISDESKEYNAVTGQLPLAGDTVKHGDDIELWIVTKDSL